MIFGQLNWHKARKPFNEIWQNGDICRIFVTAHVAEPFLGRIWAWPWSFFYYYFDCLRALNHLFQLPLPFSKDFEFSLCHLHITLNQRILCVTVKSLNCEKFVKWKQRCSYLNLCQLNIQGSVKKNKTQAIFKGRLRTDVYLTFLHVQLSPHGNLFMWRHLHTDKAISSTSPQIFCLFADPWRQLFKLDGNKLHTSNSKLSESKIFSQRTAVAGIVAHRWLWHTEEHWIVWLSLPRVAKVHIRNWSFCFKIWFLKEAGKHNHQT